MTVTTSNSYPNQNGSRTVYDFTFDVIELDDVFCKIDGELVPSTDYTVGTPQQNQVTFNTAPVGDLVIFRESDAEPITAVFQPGNPIRAVDLNDNFKQLLYLVQEDQGNIAEGDASLQDQINILEEEKVSTIVGESPITATRVDQEVTVGIDNASSSQDGAMSKEDKAKLDTIAAGAQPGTVTRVTGALPVRVDNHTTTPFITVDKATQNADGIMSKEDKEKLDSVQFVEVHNATFQEAIDGTRKTFTLDHRANSAYDLTVSVNGIIQQANVHYTWDAALDQITFISPPPINSEYWITISGFQMADGTVGGFQTTATLPTAPGNFAQALRLIAPYETYDDDVPFQKDVNQLFNTTNLKSALNAARTSNLIDFTQDTSVQGYWVHTEDKGTGDVPDVSEFFAYDSDGNNEQQFSDVAQFVFNDNGIAANPGTENKLETARIGDQLVVQELQNNHFGQYVITDIVTENKDGVIYRTFDVKVYKQGQRAFGDVQFFAHCSVRVMRPVYTVVMDEQPFVSSRGVLWYRESDDVLSISNYGDGFIGIGPQWTEINGSGGGGDYLPLTGGSISGNLSVSGSISNVGGILLAGPKESALRVYDTQGGQVFDVHCDKFGVGAQYYGAVEQPNHIATKEYVDSVDLDDRYLPLTGGTMKATFSMGNKQITALGDPVQPGQAANKRYVDDNFLKLTGGSMTGNIIMNGTDLTTHLSLRNTRNGDVNWMEMASNGQNNISFDKSGGEARLYVHNDFTPFQICGNKGNKMSGEPFLRIDQEGNMVLQHLIDPTEEHQAVSKAYLDRQIKPPGLAKYKFAGDRNIVNLRPGEFCGFDAQNNPQSVLESISTIAFHGQDIDGNRPAPDDDVVSFDLGWASVFQILNSDATRTYLRATGGSHKLDDYLVFQYNKDADIYYVAWANERQVTFPSTFVRFTNSQTVTLRFPDWFL